MPSESPDGDDPADADRDRDDPATAPDRPPAPPETEGGEVADSRIEELETEVDELSSRVEELESEKEELTDALARAKADYANYKKRAKRGRREAAREARAEMVGVLAEVVDNVHRAMDADPDPEVRKGLELVLRHIEGELDDLGVETLAPEPGDPFDPNEHEAFMTEETDTQEPDTIIERLAPGYELQGRQVRPAMVKVAKAPTEDGPDGGPGSEESEDAA